MFIIFISVIGMLPLSYTKAHNLYGNHKTSNIPFYISIVGPADLNVFADRNIPVLVNKSLMARTVLAKNSIINSYFLL